MERTPLETRAAATSAQDFPDLHATRPVMWSQVVAQSPQPSGQFQNQQRSLEAHVTEAQQNNMLVDQIYSEENVFNGRELEGTKESVYITIEDKQKEN